MGGALSLPHPHGHQVQEVGGQLVISVGSSESISAHVNIPACTIALHILAPLSPTFTEKKGETPVKTKHKHVLSSYVLNALKPWLSVCPCMPLTRVFQIAFRFGGKFSPSVWDGKLCWGDLIYWWWKPEEEWFWSYEHFSKLKTTFC